MKEAMFYEKLEGDQVQCKLCPHDCTISNGRTGICGVRKNWNGRLFSLVYGKICSMSIDPIEKKPLFHFAPGTECLSICTVGCNLGCVFCQNWEISHPEREIGHDMSPEDVIRKAMESGVPGIAYTYTEPTIAWEFYYETMKLARDAGLYNVWVSNGYTNPEPARKIARLMDAVNVDLKGDSDFYKKLCGVPDDEPIYEALKIYKNAGVWVEVTNLVIPGHNDKPEQVRKIAEWVKRNLGEDTPTHFSRFHPDYRMREVGPTPIRTLDIAAETARKVGLNWVYIGNVPGHDNNITNKPEIPIKGKRWMK